MLEPLKKCSFFLSSPWQQHTMTVKAIVHSPSQEEIRSAGNKKKEEGEKVDAVGTKSRKGRPSSNTRFVRFEFPDLFLHLGTYIHKVRSIVIDQ